MGDDVVVQVQDEGRSKVRNSLTPLTAQLALQRILPFPCKKQYTVVILMPWASRFKRLRSFIRSVPNHYGRDATVSHMILLLLLCTYSFLEISFSLCRMLQENFIEFLRPPHGCPLLLLRFILLEYFI